MTAQIKTKETKQDIKEITKITNAFKDSVREDLNTIAIIKKKKNSLCKEIKQLESDIHAMSMEINDLKIQIAVKEWKQLQKNSKRDELINEIRALDKNYDKEQAEIIKRLEDFEFIF